MVWMSRPKMNLFLGVLPLTCYRQFHLKICLERRVIFLQGLMQSLGIVFLYKFPDAFFTFPDRLVWFCIDLLVFQGSPESFYENIVDHSAFAVHADLYLFRLENRDKFLAGELCPLVSVEIFRFSSLQGLF